MFEAQQKTLPALLLHSDELWSYNYYLVLANGWFFLLHKPEGAQLDITELKNDDQQLLNSLSYTASLDPLSYVAPFSLIEQLTLKECRFKFVFELKLTTNQTLRFKMDQKTFKELTLTLRFYPGLEGKLNIIK